MHVIPMIITYMFTGNTLRHRDSLHFLWGKHLQCSLSKNKVIMGLVLVVTYPSKWARRVELSIINGERQTILCLWISKQLFWL